MSKEIKSLNELYNKDLLHYWCNATGDLHLPGTDFETYTPTLEELPPMIRDLYEKYWDEMGWFEKYIVTLNGKHGVAMVYHLDHESADVIYERVTDQGVNTEADNTQLKKLSLEAGKKTAQDMQHAIKSYHAEAYFGEATDPDGNEILVFLPHSEDLSQERYEQLLQTVEGCMNQIGEHFGQYLSYALGQNPNL